MKLDKFLKKYYNVVVTYSVYLEQNNVHSPTVAK